MYDIYLDFVFWAETQVRDVRKWEWDHDKAWTYITHMSTMAQHAKLFPEIGIS